MLFCLNTNPDDRALFLVEMPKHLVHSSHCPITTAEQLIEAISIVEKKSTLQTSSTTTSPILYQPEDKQPLCLQLLCNPHDVPCQTIQHNFQK